ncbi:ABC transporter permease [Alkalihalobacillus alcalophilus ATCC 27647 = CGMCC 1.3604]|uniref:ABC transporter permease n=1 Tax=Alkalihalobacillus alcalophilus ATCC 27647 = CGMCC 1.3604 TaxID=1218173 RepID=J8Q4P0_ALKAL|nr:sugar ABC transporter permease [Alkalihalobacillus alcalophilus]AFV25959.1 sugar transporter [Alkalihalobacillus alcalophilus ATCC 27647 = CGMCC 1.3604]KGA98904.1 ABC transporter permease [Alkalihalobacillus alcalophilus ATCC 27647 = CGMCC 1.3604]MED1560545.1 sugar ABC transporter permease [Alkalihalobacillus alcalophilus]THG90060.1 ABC transporter permease [Alkalihalobacillus alcalophilus ATCC 27647 = CGMCC 1.3604]
MKGDRLYIILFMTPALLMAGIFLYYPFFENIKLSFYRTDGFFNSTFIGFDNYIRLFNDQIALNATLNTLELMLYVAIFQVGIALVLAIMVDSIKRGAGFFRTTFFFPIVISGAAIGLLFSLIYNYRNGLLNEILVSFGLERQVWLTESSALYMVAIPTIWHYVGFYFIIILTAIAKIPDDFYEAAKLEGITGWKRMTKITLPLIVSDMKTCLILAITGALKIFELVYIITRGGHARQSEVLGTYMYQKAIVDNAMGYGATLSILMVVIGLTLAFVTNKLLKREEVTY